MPILSFTFSLHFIAFSPTNQAFQVKKFYQLLKGLTFYPQD